ncbi:helix-turn-helix transcriptional regulator [Marivirga sp. S37H4]|uniref:Helix-turn-helix transcriptional regulator n=1 Tax=Marivirga aurantiaca TaxID=2802615 RepID=A0A935C8M5_9BACT|nr:helix-turn-helix transcriptional regulator [Marivirga aurantiaca]MBK6265691.1 helix-turn-helix transcriptional regulator [Marivirga aurantiaca]
MEIQKRIGIQIAKIRRQKGLTQEDLADLADIHPDYIGKIERGERSPSLIRFLKILDALKFSYSEFFKDFKGGIDNQP